MGVKIECDECRDDIPQECHIFCGDCYESEQTDAKNARNERDEADEARDTLQKENDELQKEVTSLDTHLSKALDKIAYFEDQIKKPFLDRILFTEWETEKNEG